MFPDQELANTLVWISDVMLASLSKQLSGNFTDLQRN